MSFLKIRNCGLAISVLFLAACQTTPQIRTYIPWRSFEINQECIRKAIDATPGIEFEKQEDHDGGTCIVRRDCWKMHYLTYYRLKDTKTDASAYILFSEYWDGTNSLEDVSKAAPKKDFTPEDRAALLKAQNDLNETIHKICRDAGQPHRPSEGH
jgi:hypothetical protein